MAVLNGTINIGGKTYANGKLPAGVLVPLAYAKNQRLYSAAADAWNRVNEDFRKKTGVNIDITDAYRAYSGTSWSQEEIFKDRYRKGYKLGADNRRWNGVWYHRVKGSAAAVPGTSNHGLGRAVDVNLGKQQYFGSDYYNTLRSVAAKHGFNNDVGRTINEPWHWEYAASQDRGKTKPKPKSHSRWVTQPTHVYSGLGKGRGRLLPKGTHFTVLDGSGVKHAGEWWVKTTAGNWVRGAKTTKKKP